MITADELAALQQRLKKFIAEEDLGLAIRAAIASVPSHAAVANTLILLQARLYEAQSREIKGLIEPDHAQRTLARIRADLLTFIENLSVQDFQPALAGNQLPANKTGHLLYAIPPTMPLERDSRCLVRLAFEKETLFQDLEEQRDITTRPVRIAEVMDVALIDPNDEDVFQIRPLSSPEQFVEQGDYSEWIFLVKPLRSGTFPLILRVAVIEVRQGKERRKEIVLEESVRIVAEAVGMDEAEPRFKEAGVLSTSTGPDRADDQPELDEDFDDVRPPSPRITTPGTEKDRPSPAPPPRPKPESAPSARPKTTLRRRWLAIAASLALLVSIGLWTIVTDRNFSTGPAPDVNPVEPYPSPDVDPDSLARDTLPEN